IFLSARAGEESRLEGLDAGADDYLIKPFSARELLVRVGALLERTRMRRESETRYRELVEQLREADRRKDEFLATLAHELRNPLAPVRYAAAILRPGASPAVLDKARQTIERQSAHLARLLDDLLDVSRIARNAITLKLETLDLRRSVQEALELARPAMQAQAHRVTLSLPLDPVWIAADAERMIQIVGNLLSNAIKYTEAGGTIAVALETVGVDAVLRIQDSGVGFPPEAAPELFELFRQVHKGTRMAEGGLGIGLTVVRQLVQLHNGEIEAHSAGPGQGATFTIRLPVVAAAGAELSPAPTGEIVPLFRASVRVLVIEDNQDAAESLAMFLRREALSVHVAHSGLDGLQLAQSIRPNLVILDIGLPDMSGYEVAQQLRHKYGAASLRIVAVSGWAGEEDRQRSRQAGADLHLAKPVDPQRLLEIIQTLDSFKDVSQQQA
ncbi:MAG: response regulator, partial [Sinobacteraceae bacterium]|nr:response regulator [Nevskiaceae bacterium]